LATLFDAQLLSCVFHNRSDAFIENHLQLKKRGLPNLDRLLKSLDMPLRHRQTIVQSIKNQYPEYLGKHLLPDGMHFVDALDTETLDLIIIDNYMDITPVLKSPRWAPDASVFVNHAHIKNAKDILVNDAKALSVTASVQNFQRICQIIRQKQPEATIVFLQFPYNLYASKKRHHRCTLFQQMFHLEGLDNVLIMPPVTVPLEYMDGVPQHYTPEQYTFYAGIIYAFIKSQGAVLPTFSERRTSSTATRSVVREESKKAGASFLGTLFKR
jgi:hypothetical protein